MSHLYNTIYNTVDAPSAYLFLYTCTYFGIHVLSSFVIFCFTIIMVVFVHWWWGALLYLQHCFNFLSHGTCFLSLDHLTRYIIVLYLVFYCLVDILIFVKCWMVLINPITTYTSETWGGVGMHVWVYQCWLQVGCVPAVSLALTSWWCDYITAISHLIWKPWWHWFIQQHLILCRVFPSFSPQPQWHL